MRMLRIDQVGVTDPHLIALAPLPRSVRGWLPLLNTFNSIKLHAALMQPHSHMYDHCVNETWILHSYGQAQWHW